MAAAGTAARAWRRACPVPRGSGCSTKAVPELGERGADGLGAGGHDDDRPRDPGGPHEGDRVVDERAAAQEMQDLRLARAHALPLARGQDDGPGHARARGARRDGRGLPRHGPPRAADRDRRAG